MGPQDEAADVADESDRALSKVDATLQEDAGPAIDAGYGGCHPASLDLYAWMQTGELMRVPFDTLEPTSIGTPPCLAAGVVAATLDRSGTIWAQTADGGNWWVSVDTLECRAIGWALTPSALTFVGSRLFGLEAGRLYEIDTSTFEPRTVGLLDKGAWLADDGQGLLAIAKLDDTLLSVDRIDREYGGAEALRRVDATDPVRGATYWQSGLTVMLGAQLARYGEADSTALPITDFGKDLFAGIFAASCTK